MGPAKVKIDPVAGEDAAIRCEPAVESDAAAAKGDSWQDAMSDDDDRVPEEAGYGYGV